MSEPVDVSAKPPIEPAYLGDGCYVRFDGYQLWVYTHNGIRTLSEVALEPGVYRELAAYAKRVGF